MEPTNETRPLRETVERNTPLEISATLLCNPKEKLSGSVRRGLMRSRETVLNTPRKEKTERMEKLLRKLAALPLAKLIRRITQGRNHSRRAKSLADKLAQDSIFRPELDKRQRSAQALEMLATAEVNYRLNRPHDGQPNNDNNVTGPTC